MYLLNTFGYKFQKPSEASLSLKEPVIRHGVLSHGTQVQIPPRPQN
jgi:hypothetical protein